MANSKTDKSRETKKEHFKKQAKKAAAQAEIPRTHLVPQTEWQSTDVLEMRGDLAEAFELNMMKAWEAINAAGKAFSSMMSLNIQAKKVKLTYIWNNGEAATDEEVRKFEESRAMVQQLQQEQMEKLQQTLKDEQEGKGVILETVGGAPLTEENLEREKGGLIVVP